MAFIVTSLINGWLLRSYTVKNYFELKPLIGDLAVLLILGSFGYFIKPKHQFKYFFSLALIFNIMCMINSVYYTNYSSYASLSLLPTIPQLFGVTDAVDSIMGLKDFAFLWQLIVLMIINYYLKKNKYYVKVSKIEEGKIRALNTLVVGLIFIGFFISMLTSLDIGRLGKQWNREYVVMKFGIYTYQLNDIVTSLKPKISPLFGYDDAYHNFKEYFENKNNNATNNKYTNIFEGKNIIVIHAESIQNFTLNYEINNKEITPNLNKLSKEGIYFSNFYAQDSVGTSSDSEFTFNTSLMPATSGTVAVSYFDREYVSTPKLLKEKGYYTFSMHGNNGTYWNRNVFHESLGYDKFYYYKKDFDIDEKIGLGLSDKSFFRQAIPKIEDIANKNTPFYGTMIMLSNHTPFTWIEGINEFDVTMKYSKLNEETGEIEELIAPYMEKTKLGSYIKSVNYADQAIGQFIEDLDQAGLLENTVIVIYGDHDAKLNRKEFLKLYNYDPLTDEILPSDDLKYLEYSNYDHRLNTKVPFIIWTKDKKLQKKYSTEITTVMGMYDVLPTLANMFGFNNKFALGQDIFNVDENIVVFPDGDFVTNKIYYNNQKEEIYNLNPENPIEADIQKYIDYADDLIKISNDIVVYDLIKKEKETKSLLEG